LASLGTKPPDGWIPSSSAWLKLASIPAASASASPEGSPAGQSAQPSASASGAPGYFAERPVSLARSPVVLAAPKPFAQAVGWPAKQPSWAELATRASAGQGPKISVENPLKGTSGLLSVLGVYAAMGRTTPDPGLAQMRALTIRSKITDPEADPAALLKRMQQQTDPVKALQEVGVFPVREQALFEYLKGKPAVPLVGLYPPDGTMEAEYPLLLSNRIAGDPVAKQAADRLVAKMHAPEFLATLSDSGFRPARGAASATGTAAAPVIDGLVAQYAQPVPVPENPVQVAQLAGQWSKYKRLTYQVLVLLDASGSMNDPVRDKSGRMTTKAELLRLAGVQASALFGEETSLALWTFATPSPTSPPYAELIPFGPLNDKIGAATRRDVLRSTAQTYKPYEQAGTPLYEAVLRGVTAMRGRFRPDAVTLVVVLTDGREQDNRYTMTRPDFLGRLSAGRDPARPVPIFSIGYGSDADMPTLTDMSRATGGRAIASNDPGDLASAIARVFLAAHQAG
jgi:Mg-chelatase subunit ChlD